ncbi:hypothetical protein CHS0354_033157 [Potamilus streckersoni]|uniref:Peptidase S1 domain-containing protein n=1 Tax=Potamilus streckersoni TaxID=2493646 RepID=A0AAE0S6C7_9BIVA|nr:hypothetical protein CHS0354_033157 [Potamilus streckersoni]
MKTVRLLELCAIAAVATVFGGHTGENSHGHDGTHHNDQKENHGNHGYNGIHENQNGLQNNNRYHLGQIGNQLALNSAQDNPGQSIPIPGQGNVPEPFQRYGTVAVSWWNAYLADQQSCGVQKIKPNNPYVRILGGHLAKEGSWPWMVSMFSTLIGQPWCAGTLIGRQWVLTAAHCFRFHFADPTKWVLRFGIYNASGASENSREQVRLISRLIMHPDFNDTKSSFSFDNDIALIKLDRPVTFADVVSPLCLPVANDPMNEGQSCVISGYGIANLKNPIAAAKELNLLHQATVPLIVNRRCAMFDGYADKVTTNMVCAGYTEGEVDACFGDSGGPIQCETGWKWHITGITSWGGKKYDTCAEPGQPGVYTAVQNYMSWIQNQMFLDFFHGYFRGSGK